MSDHELTIAGHKLEAGAEFWVRRDQVSKLTAIAYHFETRDYDAKWVKIEIIGHADDPDLEVPA